MTIIDFPLLGTNSNDQLPDTYITSHDLARLAGITYRQLDYWTRTGLIHSPNTGANSGTLRIYPRTEIATACLLAQLLHAGLTRRIAHDIARTLLEHGQARLGPITIHLPEDL